MGNGCWERRDDGLSNFGLDAIREMNALGILIDLSHVGDRTTLEAIELSEKPVAITHANARSYFNHPRNKTDDALKLLAERRGVIGATSITSFLPTQFESTLEDYVDAIDDMVERVGIDHVGVGTDFTQDQPTLSGSISARSREQNTRLPLWIQPCATTSYQCPPRDLRRPTSFQTWELHC